MSNFTASIDITTDIPIWPGSSSFASSSKTPFGFFDSDPDFIVDADKVAAWASRRLGYPIMDIELQDINFYACFEEAVCEYSRQVNEFNIIDNLINIQGSTTASNLTQRLVSSNFGQVIELSNEYGTEVGTGGNVRYRSASIDIKDGVQKYDLDVLISDAYQSGSAIEIRKVYHQAPPASLRFYDPYLGNQTMLDTFGFGAYSTGVSFMLMPMYADLLRVQAIEFNDLMRKSSYGFHIVDNEMTIFPVPNGNYKVWIEYIVKSDRSNPLKYPDGLASDMSNVPYGLMSYREINSVGRKWIFDYALALIKEMLGYVRGKYSSIPIPNSEVSLNYSDLITGAQQEKEKLIELLRETLQELSKMKQLERKSQEAEFLQEQLKRMPLKIYIG